jgi:UDP-glucuronate decarboxylase
MMELASLVIELVGSEGGISYQPLPSDDPTQRQPDITRAGSELAWTPWTELREGLAATIDYFRQQSDTGASRPASVASRD